MNDKQVRTFIYLVLQVISKCRMGKRIVVVVVVLICNEIYFDAPDLNSACERT